MAMLLDGIRILMGLKGVMDCVGLNMQETGKQTLACFMIVCLWAAH